MRRENHSGLTDNQKVDQWISAGVSSPLITWIVRKSEDIKRDKLTNTQMRNFFNEVRRIHELWMKNKDLDGTHRLLLMLRPKLMYLVKKNKYGEQSTFRKLMDRAIERVCQEIILTKPSSVKVADPAKVKSPSYYIQNFMDFNEALLAYHYGKE